MSRIPKILRQARPNFRTPPRYGTQLPKRVVADPSRIDLARKYFMADLPGSIIPATRLHNILENLEQGRPLPLGALTYLQQHGLFALQQLARGEITYEAFCKTAAKEEAKREQSAEAESQKEEAAWLQRIEQDKAQDAIRNAKYERDRQRAEEARR